MTHERLASEDADRSAAATETRDEIDAPHSCRLSQSPDKVVHVQLRQRLASKPGDPRLRIAVLVTEVLRRIAQRPARKIREFRSPHGRTLTERRHLRATGLDRALRS